MVQFKACDCRRLLRTSVKGKHVPPHAPFLIRMLPTYTECQVHLNDVSDFYWIDGIGSGWGKKIYYVGFGFDLWTSMEARFLYKYYFLKKKKKSEKNNNKNYTMYLLYIYIYM